MNRKELFYPNQGNDNTVVCDRQKLEKYLDRLEAQLAAYQKAFNQVDDYSEYRQFTREDFKTIADNLTIRLKNIDDTYK